MKQLDFKKLTFQKHLNDKVVSVFALPRLTKLSLKQAVKLYNWLGMAIEEAERLKPHDFKKGDRVRVKQVIRRATISGLVTVSRKYIYGTVKDYSNNSKAMRIGKPRKHHDRRIEVVFDTKEPMTCPICLRECGSTCGLRADPKTLELVT